MLLCGRGFAHDPTEEAYGASRPLAVFQEPLCGKGGEERGGEGREGGKRKG